MLISVSDGGKILLAMVIYISEIFSNYWLVAVKLALALATAVVFLKLFNMNSQLKQLTPISVVLNFLLSAILSSFILDDEFSITAFFVIMIIYGALLAVVNWLSFNTSFGRRMFVGTPRVIVQNGEFRADVMRKMRLNVRDVAAAMRAQDVHSLRDIRFAQVEANGDLTIVKKGDENYSVVLIDNGVVDTAALEKIGKTELWLMAQLHAKKIRDPENVFIAQYHHGKISVIKKK